METERKWICEWCKYSDIPKKEPTSCRIMLCSKHGDVWHYLEEEEKRGEIVDGN